VLIEPIQGEGGIRLLDINYLHDLRRICDEHEWLLMLDEVQCGLGRTGKWFAFQHTDIMPDVMTLAKGLGSGVPVGACLTAGKATGTFKPGNHGSTFGGNPLASTAALTTLNILEQDKLLDHAATLGAWIKQQLQSRLGSVKGVVTVRGQGLMLGIELDKPCAEMVGKALDKGLLINVTADNVIRLLPSLVFSQAEALQMLDILCPLVTEFLAQE
jgi:acetylornithine aminotransferase